MSDLTPKTRDEMLLSGENLEPKNRKEMFLKRIYDKTQSVPEPETREEYFLKKAGDASGDITIEQLNVTESGTYAEQGKAYSPVVVNVPSYLVKDVPNLPQAVASFDDGEEYPIIKLKFDITAVQSGSGDPSPENVRPISGWDGANVTDCGVNLWDEEWESGTINSSGEKVNDSNYIRSKNYIPVRPNTDYYLVTGSALHRIFFYDANKTFISFGYSAQTQGKKYTTPDNCYYVLFRPESTYGTTYNNDISLNYPSTDTSYHAYNGNTYPISWQAQSGTVYGGNFKLFKDGGKWYCTVTAEKSFVIATSENTVRNSGTQYYVSITGVKNNAGASNLKSNKFKTYTSGSYSEANICFLNSNGTMRFNTASEYSSVSDMLTAIGEIQLVYPLATPTTTTFEIDTEIATLLGNNNIFADCGDVEECRYVTGTL